MTVVTLRFDGKRSLPTTCGSLSLSASLPGALHSQLGKDETVGLLSPCGDGVSSWRMLCTALLLHCTSRLGRLSFKRLASPRSWRCLQREHPIFSPTRPHGYGAITTPSKRR